MYIVKRISALLLSLIVIASMMILPASAIEADVNDTPQLVAEYLETLENEFSVNDISALGLAFMRYSAENADIELRNTTAMYDLNGNVTAYCVDFELDNVPSGYVIISMLNLSSPFVEFSYFGESPVDLIQSTSMIDSAGSSYNTTSDEIIYLGTLDYYQRVSNSELIAYPSYEVVSSNIIEQQYYSTLSSMASPLSDFDFEDIIDEMGDTGLTRSDIVLSDDAIWNSGSDFWIMRDFASGNVCAPTAATNVIWYWGDLMGYDWCIDAYSTSSSDQTRADAIFAEMDDLMWTSSSTGTWDVLVNGAYNSYLSYANRNEGMNHDYNIDDFYNPSYATFRSCINDGSVVHTCMRRDGVFASGHDVMTCGYGETNNGTQYLVIFDGWERYGRCVNYDSIPQLTHCVSVYIEQ